MTIEDFISMRPGDFCKVNDEVISPAAHIGIPEGTTVVFKYVFSTEADGVVTVQIKDLPILLCLKPKFLDRA